LFSYSLANTYSEGFKIYKLAKKELRLGNTSKATKLFLQAKVKFEESAKKNSSQAYLKLAELYCNGWGVKADDMKAAEYLSKAKKLGASFISDKCLKNLK
jgi:TPR repeat protein